MQEGQPQTIITPSTQDDGWRFHAEEQTSATASTQSPTSIGESVQWTASEFIAHEKSIGWYALLALGTALLAGIVFLLTKDKISTGVVVIVAIVFGIFAARKPRELPYNIDDKGIKIGEKDYLYTTFRSFSVVQEGSIESIWFMPLKRFMPIITIYFEPNEGKKIVDLLSEHLPLENKQLDLVDRLMHRLRF